MNGISTRAENVVARVIGTPITKERVRKALLRGVIRVGCDKHQCGAITVYELAKWSGVTMERSSNRSKASLHFLTTRGPSRIIGKYLLTEATALERFGLAEDFS